MPNSHWFTQRCSSRWDKRPIWIGYSRAFWQSRTNDSKNLYGTGQESLLENQGFHSNASTIQKISADSEYCTGDSSRNFCCK